MVKFLRETYIDLSTRYRAKERGIKMRRKYADKKLLLVFLIGVMAAGVFGCGNGEEKKPEMGENTVNLMEEINTQNGKQTDGKAEETEAPVSAFYTDSAEFALNLLKENLKTEKGNVMVSPTSVLSALAMTANGAKEETLSQMLSVIAKNQNINELNAGIAEWTNKLVNTKGAGIKLANSIWFKDDESRILVNQDFLVKNADYYGADIYKTAFDQSTLADINNWVSEKTDGKIKEILDKLPEEAVMYLINAISFDAEWQTVYKEHQIREDVFVNADGQEENGTFMYGMEELYIGDESADGFIKPYKEGYSFIALLPKEGISPEAYISGLTGERFLALLEGQKEAVVHTVIPQFQAEYQIELKEILENLGMPEAFDEERADFTNLGTSPDGNIYISRVLHKTYIAVDGMGTSAGAATVVEMVTESAMEGMDTEVYSVYLKRPFVYAIIENETNIPIFIGVTNSIK